MLRKFLPNDTRLVELISGGSLVIGMLIGILTNQYILPAELLSYHVWQFWTMMLGIFGILQVGACSVHRLEYLRAATNWLIGGYWIWVGAHQIAVAEPYLTATVSILIGVSCFYAFVVNLLLARQAWKR